MDSIRIRLLKVLRLAQEGVGGERENAEVLLAKLLRKHSMTMADLEGAADQPGARVWLPSSSDDERTVLAQLVAKMFGTARKVWRGSNTFDLGVDVTPSEHAALMIAWEVYRAAFAEARQALVLGFCYKHGLFAAAGADDSSMTDEARARAARALALAEALPEVQGPTRRIK
ncbi:MAG: hypothetical protein ABIY52_05605 [Gemmatimonadaceae bacterium]